MVPVKEGYPYERAPKVAFMFLTRGPLPMLPLWEKFFRGNEKYLSVYVHTPPGYDMNVSSDSPFYDRQVPSQVRFDVKVVSFCGKEQNNARTEY